MKKITKAAALLAASALLFGGLFLSCSSDDDDDNTTGGSEKEVEKADDDNNNPNGGGNDGTVDEPKLVVNATWDFKTDLVEKGSNVEFSSYPISLADKGSNSIDSGKEKGATLTITGGNKFKWKDETSDNANAYGLYCASKKVAEGTSYTTLDYKDSNNYAYGILELTTNDSSSLSFDISANTEGYNAWFIVTDKDGKVVLAKENLVKNNIETLATSSPVAAGTYTIYMQASRLHKVTAENALTANASDVKTTITLKVPDEKESVFTDLTFDIGATTISESELNTKIKAADAAKTFITEIVNGLNELVTLAGVTDKTATADSFNFVFFASEADWKAYDDAEEDSDEKTTALAKKLSTITAGTPVYISFALTDEFMAWFDNGDAEITPYTELFAKYKTSADAVDFTENSTTDWLTGEKGTTYFFEKGVSVTLGSTNADTKFAKKSTTLDSYTATNCVQLGKKSNGSYMTIPVEGNCVIRILWHNNKSIATTDSDTKATNNSRGLYATASATGATIKSVGGAYSDTAFYGYKANTDYNAKNELATFNYTGSAGTVKIEVCSDDSGTSAGGACYVYLVDVAAN